MDATVKALIGIAAFTFVLAVVGSIFPDSLLAGAPGAPEAYSRASTNLALLAIALGVATGRVAR